MIDKKKLAKYVSNHGIAYQYADSSLMDYVVDGHNEYNDDDIVFDICNAVTIEYRSKEDNLDNYTEVVNWSTEDDALIEVDGVLLICLPKRWEERA